MRTVLLGQQWDRTEKQEKMHSNAFNKRFWSIYNMPCPVSAAGDTGVIKVLLLSPRSFCRAFKSHGSPGKYTQR